MYSSSHCDVDRAVAFHHVIFLQADAPVDHMASVRQMKLIAVPGTDEVHVVLVEALAEIGATLSDQVDHLRQLEALADRAALMRAEVAVGVVAAPVADH